MRSKQDRIETLVDGRRERLSRALGRPLQRPAALERSEPLDEEGREHLMDYATELYWNELEWENITSEEEAHGGPLPQLIFPGFLAYLRALLLREALPDAKAPAEPRPEVAEDVLRFLAKRVVELEEEVSSPDPDEPERLRAELRMTSRLLDAALHQYHGLSTEDVERVEAAGRGA